MDARQLAAHFEEQYGSGEGEVRFFHAPGRVNLIGEHIDYNGGYVLPAALEFGTTLLIRPRSDRMIRLSSTNFPYQLTVAADEAANAKTGEWTDYPVGVMVELAKSGRALSRGYDILVHGDIPNGAGLSSSASLEVAAAYALLTLEGHPIDRTDIAQLSQRAENRFVGVNCGIMDQFAVANGKQDHAILLMCDTLEFKHVPFRTEGYKLVIGNTNKRRGLVDSKYNERRAQCDEAVRELRQAFPELELLAQLDAARYEANKHLIQDEAVRKRAAHVIAENERVLQSVEALQQHELERFGQLMIASHESLRDLYEVSCEELDVMVEEALRIEGTAGSRMTGAGFGGCTVSLVKESAVPRFIEQVGEAYQRRTGLTAEFYVCSVGDGVKEQDCSNKLAAEGE
ncbi:galactokinase [Paenibacillus thiaminolyticus]|uniref:galactokinase n=1 Tax=Paenibacillus thiaminolyticus TaxID=49283 RepID=UPI00232AC009|nr:galactokinase [Paenibacillus thiaminolyticus]WCF09847.1 galactokinase [Paenibacillus thiaminolyticus]